MYASLCYIFHVFFNPSIFLFFLFHCRMWNRICSFFRFFSSLFYAPVCIGKLSILMQFIFYHHEYDFTMKKKLCIGIWNFRKIFIEIVTVRAILLLFTSFPNIWHKIIRTQMIEFLNTVVTRGLHFGKDVITLYIGF